MQGQKELNPKMLYQVHIDDLVPKDNYYRLLDKELDLRFLYSATAKYYGSEGQESIDPVVFFKICLIGYLNNIGSDRKLIEFCSNCLDTRLFLRYDIDEPLPWHSTISRTRQLYGEEVFLDLFRRILSLCVNKGMVRGKRQAIDSAFIKANASLDSLVEKEVLDDVKDYADELNENSEYKVKSETNTSVSQAKKKSVEQHHRWKEEAYKDMPGHSTKEEKDEFGNIIRPKYLSNHTHYSPTDKDARISVKPGKARQMNYFGQISVDDAHHVITGALADFADKRDSQCLPDILGQTIENLQQNNISIDQIAADTGYSSGEALKFCKENNIDAYIPNHGQYRPHREGFTYNQILDQYQCTRGNKAVLPYRKTSTSANGYTKKVYRSNNTKCKNCPLRDKCIGKSDFKKIEDSIDRPFYDAMHQKFEKNPEYAKRIKTIRSKTVEPVLGTLTQFMNMKRVNTRGIKQANKHVLMAALSYNLQKYLKFLRKNAHENTAALCKASQQVKKTLQSLILMLKSAFLNIFFYTEFYPNKDS